MPEHPLMLSVSGMRGWIGDSLTPDIAARYAAAVGNHFQQTRQTEQPLVMLGRDSRPSGQIIEQAAIAGLTAAGCRVCRLGIASTPAVALKVVAAEADGGMVITASHNPINWNGIKALNHEGLAPPADQARRIIDAFNNNEIRYVSTDRLQSIEQDESANEVHVEKVLQQVDAEVIRTRRPKVVVDSVHGAGGPEAGMLLHALGVEVVHFYAEPTGQFPHAPEPLAENLTGLCDAVVEHQADLGFAQDPDADRLAIVDDQGRYIGEEYTLVLGAWQVFGRREIEAPVAAANLSSSRMIDDLAALFEGTAHRAPVGEANVVSAMKQHNAIVGGEGGGGIIWPAVGYVRDSLVGMALTLELICSQARSLSELIKVIPAYAMIKAKTPIQPGMAEQAIETLKQKYADQRIDLQDGIRIDFEDRWAHVRPSNTEPILRIIAEAPDQDAASALVKEIEGLIAQ